MEFLLANHPLDCPICDQGGECDLQDQSVRYGSDRSRFNEIVGKRAVENKNLGPLVKTVMTRCIQCTRCVRFANEVAGATELGTSGRGNDMQIGTYVEKVLKTEMSGNVIDLCPVGALTSKPYAFTTRPWELKKTESIDVLDGLGSNIRVDTRGFEVMRILPRVNDDVNEEWISDKTRFAYDGLKRQRLTVPMIKKDGKFVESTWKEALEVVASAFNQSKPEERAVIAGQLADAESLVALKDVFNTSGSENVCLEGLASDLSPSFSDIRSNYLLNSRIPGVEEADLILLVGTNPRHEAPVLNTRIRKAFLQGTDIALVGEKPDLNYDFDYLGNEPSLLESLSKGKHEFYKKLVSAKKPLILVGSGVFERTDAVGILGSVAHLVEKLKKKVDPTWSIYNVLQRVSVYIYFLFLYIYLYILYIYIYIFIIFFTYTS
jgi:NADH dehydrogenase (ubiquinone) Fe-S protein 1